MSFSEKKVLLRIVKTSGSLHLTIRSKGATEIMWTKRELSIHAHFNYKGFTSLLIKYYQNLILIRLELIVIYFTILYLHAGPLFKFVHFLQTLNSCSEKFRKTPLETTLEYSTDIFGTAAFFLIFNGCSKAQTSASNADLHEKMLKLYSHKVKKNSYYFKRMDNQKHIK